jgi:antitoxin ParD1/3/4
MNISLTPELENFVKEKVDSGLYNNANELIREALRFMSSREQMFNEIKLEHLRHKLANAEQDILENQYIDLDKTGVNQLFVKLKEYNPEDAKFKN